MISYNLWHHIRVDGRYLTKSEKPVTSSVFKSKDWQIQIGLLMFAKKEGEEVGEEIAGYLPISVLFLSNKSIFK